MPSSETYKPTGHAKRVGSRVEVVAAPTARELSEGTIEMIVSAAKKGRGVCTLYRDASGQFLVRTKSKKADTAVRVSGNMAARILEQETRHRVSNLIAPRLDVNIRVIGEDGAIYDTFKDKELFTANYYYEAVSAYETAKGQLYFRFVDPYEEQLFVPKKVREGLEGYFKEADNADKLENFVRWFERWCLSDRSFLTFLDKAIDWHDYFEYEVILVSEEADKMRWTNCL
jgi:hypothetical protein